MQRFDLLIHCCGQHLRANVIAGCRDAMASGAGALFVHGWDSDHTHYDDLAEEVAAWGYTCLTFDLRGHGHDTGEKEKVSRADNLNDVLAAFDALAGWARVNPQRIVLIGTSYGGYLASIVTALRQVHAVALRVPALYPDALWTTPKSALCRNMLIDYRSIGHKPGANRALRACEMFDGDVLVVASGKDEILAPPTVQSFVDAFTNARSLNANTIAEADHALTDPACQNQYADLLTRWLRALAADSAPVDGGRHAA